VAALVSDMPRQAPQVRQVAAQSGGSVLTQVAKALPAGSSAGAAAAIASQMVGALQLARALGDNAEGRALLSSSRKALVEQYDVIPFRRHCQAVRRSQYPVQFTRNMTTVIFMPITPTVSSAFTRARQGDDDRCTRRASSTF
jgi:hypothetical protein